MRSSTEQSTWARLMVLYWEQILNGLVYELYFLEEPHAGGLRLLDMVGRDPLSS